MASRVNTKFLIILVIGIASAVIIIGGLAFLKIRGDAGRQARQGDEQMQLADGTSNPPQQQEHFRKAREYYERAVAKEPAEYEYLQKLENALLNIQPATGDEAAEFYQKYVAVLAHAADHDPTNPDKHLRLLEELFQNARRSGAPMYWTMLHDSAKSMWARVPDSSPQRIYARFYLGAARLSPRMFDLLPPDDPSQGNQIEQGERDLLQFLEAVPDSDVGFGTLLADELAIVGQSEAHGQPTRAEEQIQRVYEIMAQARVQAPDGLEVLMAGLRLAMYEASKNREAFDEEAVRRDVLQVVRLVQQRDDPWAIDQGVGILRHLSWMEGLPRPVEIVDQYLQGHPLAHDLRLTKANLHYLIGELDEAEQATRLVLDAPWLKVGFLSQYQPFLRRAAAGLNVDIAHARWQDADEAARGSLVASIEQARDELATLVSDVENDPIILRADAKLAYAKGEYEQAGALFDRLARDETTRDVEVCWYAALCLEQIGEPGSALEHIRTALGAEPANPNLLVQASRLLVLLRDYDASAKAAADLLVVTGEVDDPRLTALAEALRLPDYAAAAELLDVLVPANPDSRALAMANEVVRVAVSRDEAAGGDPVKTAMEAAQTAFDAGEIASARTTLLAALADAPDDLRLLGALVRLHMAADEREEAMRYLERAEELAPGSRSFQSLRLVLENEDPIDRIKQFAAATFPDDETKQTLEVLLSLRAVARRQDAQSRLFEERGQAEQARAARTLADRARQEEQTYRAKAEQIAPHSPRLVDYRFAEAILAGNWEVAEQLAAATSDPRAPEYDADQAQGMVYRGRLLLAQGEFEEAARALRQATGLIPYSAGAWRLLAVAYQQVGNFPEALNAYEKAYASNPNDIRTVALYADVLSRSGDLIKALQIVQRGHQLAPNDQDVWHQWLLLEAQVGDRGLVLRERRRQFEEEPEDVTNAAALASFLVRIEPTPETMLDEDGEPVYSPDRWFRVPAVQRQTMLRELRQQWYEEADQIVEQMGTVGERDLRWHLLKADLLRARGEIDAGEEVLRTFAEAQVDREQHLQALLSLAQYLAQVNRVPAALESFQQALEFQGEERTADLLMGQFLFNLNRFEEAASHFETVLETRPDRRLQLLVVQCHVNMRDLGEARRRFEAVIQESGSDFMTALLEAAIARAEADELWVAGQREEARRKYAENAEILDRAAQMDPMDPRPYVERARSLYGQAQRTGDLVLLDDALRALARADEVRSDLSDTSTVRVAILLAKNNRVGAINELKRLLQRQPANDDARLRLVYFLVGEGRIGEAVELLVEAVRLDPTSVARREMLGDLYKDQVQDPSAAADQYAAALELMPSSRLVRKLAEALLAKTPPDHQAALDLIGRYPNELERDPVLRSVRAMILVATGRRDEGREEMRSAYRLHRQYIAEQVERPEAIADWFLRLGSMFAPGATAEIERFVMDLSGGKPEARELQALALFWRSGGEEGLSRAIELLQRAVRECPPEDTRILADLYNELGMTLLMVQDNAGAVAAYEKVVELDPRNSSVLNNLAYTLSDMMGQADRALPYAQRAADLVPSNGPILDTLGWVQYQRGAYDEAETALRRSIQLNPTATNHYHLACVFQAKGDRRRADRYLQRAVELSPDPDTQAKINRLANDIRTMSGDQE